MARVTYVKSAQQRFATIPVIDEATGGVKTVAVTRKDGSPKTTKKGREIVRRITVADKSQPLPNRNCGKCGNEIKVGDPYKHISPKSGPYGGRTLYRCGTCPVWQVWEYSSSLSARLAEISFNAEVAFNEAESEDDVTALLTEAAEAIREVAEEKRESASNIEDGFQHPTSQSEELEQQADELDSWADEVENATVPDFPEPEEEDCGECGGTGKVDDPNAESENDDQIDCDECDGSGQITPEEVTEDQIEAWKEEATEALDTVQNSPV